MWEIYHRFVGPEPLDRAMKWDLCSDSFSLFIYLCLVFAIAFVNGDSEPGRHQPEHRNAKPEPFLDRIASLFGVGPTEKAPKPATIYQRPQGGGG